MRRASTAIALLLAVPAIAHGQGTVRDVETGDNFFEPEKVKTDVGTESLRWQWGGRPDSINPHNVREEDRLFYSGGIEVNGDFTTTPSAGTFLYVCDAHGAISGNKVIGMGGKISVDLTATPQGRKTLITWATEATDTGNKYDVRRKVGKRKPKLVEKKTKDVEGAFRLKNGKKYKFQARSRKGKAVSGWSPKLKLKG